jgi:replicative DNA helicase
VARNVAERYGPVALFSLEMSAFEVAMRLLCSEASVPYDAVRTGRAVPADWTRLMSATERLVRLPLIIDDRGLVRVPEVRATSRRIARLSLVVVDYLQLMSAHERGTSRQEEIASMSRGLKLLAKELGVPVLACAQLSREVEKRANRRPQLSDLRESGAIEQDGDVVILLHPEGGGTSNHEAIVAKHRNGPTGSIHLTFTRELTRFVDRRDPA